MRQGVLEIEKRGLKRMYRIGIVGGGQLGKMMILDAKRLDTYFVILDPTPKCPADSIAEEKEDTIFDNF